MSTVTKYLLIFDLLEISRKSEISLVLSPMGGSATYEVCCKNIKSGRTSFNHAVKAFEIIL